MVDVLFYDERKEVQGWSEYCGSTATWSVLILFVLVLWYIGTLNGEKLVNRWKGVAIPQFGESSWKEVRSIRRKTETLYSDFRWNDVCKQALTPHASRSRATATKVNAKRKISRTKQKEISSGWSGGRTVQISGDLLGDQSISIFHASFPGMSIIDPWPVQILYIGNSITRRRYARYFSPCDIPDKESQETNPVRAKQSAAVAMNRET